MAAVAFELRETNAAHAHELAKTMGGLHARYFRLCLRCRSPQAALNYAALLPRSEKLHGALMNEIAKHGTVEMVQAALDLRDHLEIPMDKYASITYSLPVQEQTAHCHERVLSLPVPPTHVCRFTLSSALSKLSSTASPEAVHRLYTRYCVTAANAETLTLDAHVFSAVLSTHADAGNASQFNDVWHNMRARGIAPTASSHACRLKLLLNTEGPYSALSHYRALSSKHSHYISPHLFSTVFSAFAAAASAADPPLQQPVRAVMPSQARLPSPARNHPADDIGHTQVTFRQLWSVWQDMCRFGIEPDDHLASAFLAAAKQLMLSPQEVFHASLSHTPSSNPHAPHTVAYAPIYRS